MLRLRRLALVALSSFAFLSSAFAQDEPTFVGSVEIAKTQAKKFRKLATTVGAGFEGIQGVFEAPKGKAFLVLHLDLKPIFAKNPQGEEAAYAYPEAVALKVEGEQPVRPIGTCDPHGRFAAYAMGYSFYASDEPEIEGYDPVFVVPEGTTNATLTLGGTTHRIAVAAEVADAVDPAHAIELKVESVRTVAQLARRQRLGTYRHEVELVQRLVTAAGRYVLVSIVLKPKVRNEPEGYASVTTNFGLLLGKEVFVSPIGYFDDGEFNESPSDFVFEEDALGEFNAAKATLVFPLPGAVKSGQLLYLGAPVADVRFDE